MPFGIMLHSALCRIQHYVAFSIMSHSALCRIQPYFVRLCVIRHNVVRHNVVWYNLVRPTVGVLFYILDVVFLRSFAE